MSVWVGVTPIPVIALLFRFAVGIFLMLLLPLGFPTLIGAGFMVVPMVRVVVLRIFHGDRRLLAARQGQQ